MKNKYVIYKVTSNEYTGMKREFATKAEAVSHARSQRKGGWSALVTDMRTGKEILNLAAK